MVTDSQKHILELDTSRILKARSIQRNRLGFFQVPSLNLNASSYVDLIDRQDKIPEPSISKLISKEDIQMFMAQEEGDLPLLLLTCHTQAVERAVKTITEASAKLNKKKI
ncbi:unnamed protein product [Psylliodes chrysocephalus]|uniref:Uncharacterized protein n=1 Tax=Psylliodes chrysocephalus TaxID=3402493 RepID=A0A9P0CUP6_9CUCU|nr:unnamed protein product [Psylliodes chrysocephala]